MKERNLLYFIVAVILSTLVLISLLIRTQVWFPIYGNYIIPQTHHLIIPLVLVWIGWYFEDKVFLVSSSLIASILFAFLLNNFRILSGDPFVPTLYAPLVRTTFVISALLLLATAALGYYTYFKMRCQCCACCNGQACDCECSDPKHSKDETHACCNKVEESE